MKKFYHIVAMTVLRLSQWANSVAYRLAVICNWATAQELEIEMERLRKQDGR